MFYEKENQTTLPYITPFDVFSSILGKGHLKSKIDNAQRINNSVNVNFKELI
jgi:hypothetical protein